MPAACERNAHAADLAGICEATSTRKQAFLRMKWFGEWERPPIMSLRTSSQTGAAIRSPLARHRGTRIPTPVCAPARNDRCGACRCRVRFRGASVRVDVGIDPYEKIRGWHRPLRNVRRAAAKRRGEVTPPYALPERFANVPYSPISVLAKGRTESSAPTK